jgi:hypothetical protein
MASFYSILQYVADPVRDERVNIGVFAFDQSRCRFVNTDDWSRLRCLAGAQSVPAVKDAVRELRRWDEKEVRTFADRPFGNFNLTQPSASLLSPEELLLFISQRVLPTQAAKRVNYRVKSAVVQVIRRQFRDRLKDRFGPGGVTLLRDKGRLIYSTKVPVNPDVVIGNGEVQSVVQALSFQEQDENKVQRDVSATGFIIRSIREAQGSIAAVPIGVVVVPPKDGSGEMSRYYDRAMAEFTDRKAHLLDESELGDWAKEQVVRLHVTI